MATLFIGPTRLGDAILVSGVLDWLGRTYPGEPITLACGAPAALALAAAPGVERVHVMQKRPRGGHWLELWRAARTRRWARVVDLRRSALAWLLRARARHIVPAARAGEHRVILASRTLGLPPQAPRLWPTPEDCAQAAQLTPAPLADAQRPVLALGIGANWIAKTWPAAHFAALAARLTAPGAAFADAAVLLVGSRTEREAAAPLLAALPPDRVIDAFGASVGATAALLERARLFVGNDSAMMHLAAAAGARTIGLFGPTQDILYSPWGPDTLVVRTPEPVEALLGAWKRRTQPGTLMAGLEVEHVCAAIAQRGWTG